MFIFSKTSTFRSIVATPPLQLMLLMVLCSHPLIHSAHAAQRDTSFSLTIQRPLHNYQASIRAERDTPAIRWFDDQPSSRKSVFIELGAQLSENNTLHYRNYTLQGSHQGEASSYRCSGILGCFWISGSILDNLDSNEEIRYRLTNHELWLEHHYPIDFPFNADIAPAVGINLLPASLTVMGGQQQESKQGLLPIPFVGMKLSVPVSQRISLNGEVHHFQFDNGRWGVKFHHLQAGMEFSISDQSTLTIGYMDYRMNLQYQRNGTHAELELPLSTPLIGISTRF